LNKILCNKIIFILKHMINISLMYNAQIIII
jgi:hypothetical protein